jgi:hypothetical protein
LFFGESAFSLKIAENSEKWPFNFFNKLVALKITFAIFRAPLRPEVLTDSITAEPTTDRPAGGRINGSALQAS